MAWHGGNLKRTGKAENNQSRRTLSTSEKLAGEASGRQWLKQAPKAQKQQQITNCLSGMQYVPAYFSNRQAPVVLFKHKQ